MNEFLGFVNTAGFDVSQIFNFGDFWHAFLIFVAAYFAHVLGNNSNGK